MGGPDAVGFVTRTAKGEYLDAILARKRREIERRRRLAPVFARLAGEVARDTNRGALAVAALRRPPGQPIRVIAEVKLRSPSAGVLRAWRAGEGRRVARAYVDGGASAVSVLADAPGFGGSVLEVRRVAREIGAPVLFKEFVIDPIQVEIARLVGASMVLLLGRALDPSQLADLVATTMETGLAPVVEAADETELARALGTRATIVGVNARDLRTFEVDVEAAARAVASIPRDRVGVFMSGIRSARDLERVAETGVDAALVGEGLMRAADPAAALRALRGVA